jgi:hypothetical protein
VAALAILERLGDFTSTNDDDDMLGWWLAERQLPNGGLNGRPEKLEDVWIFQEFLAPNLIKPPGVLLVLGAFLTIDLAKIALDRCR